MIPVFFYYDFRLQFALQTIIGLKETGIESKWKMKSFSTDAKEEVKDVEWVTFASAILLLRPDSELNRYVFDFVGFSAMTEKKYCFYGNDIFEIEMHNK